MLHRARIEGTQKTEQMIGIVEGKAIQQDQVLAQPAAAHMHAAAALDASLNARQKLKRLLNIHLAQHGRQRLDLLQRGRMPTRFQRRPLLSRYLDLVQFNRAGGKGYVQRPVGGQDKRVRRRFVSDMRHKERNRIRPDREAIETIGVTHRPDSKGGNANGHALKPLATRSVLHVAANRPGLASGYADLQARKQGYGDEASAHRVTPPFFLTSRHALTFTMSDLAQG